MTFYAKYRTDDHELVWTQAEPITEPGAGESVKEFDGDLGVKVWDPDTLTFNDYVYVTPDLPPAPNVWDMQVQLDELTRAWLEG